MVKKPDKEPDVGIVTQRERFMEAARAIGCDEDPARFDEALKKVARHKPAPSQGDKDHAESKPKRPAKPRP